MIFFKCGKFTCDIKIFYRLLKILTYIWDEKKDILKYLHVYVYFLYLILNNIKKQRVRILNVIKSLSLNKNPLFINRHQYE